MGPSVVDTVYNLCKTHNYGIIKSYYQSFVKICPCFVGIFFKDTHTRRQKEIHKSFPLAHRTAFTDSGLLNGFFVLVFPVISFSSVRVL